MQYSSQVRCFLATQAVAMWSESSLKVLNTGLRDRYSTYSQWPHTIGYLELEIADIFNVTTHLSCLLGGS
jgi:hypothetical protein